MRLKRTSQVNARLIITVSLVLIVACPAWGIAQNPTAYIYNFPKVKVSSEKTAVLARSGPGNNFRKAGRLQSGQGVYICDERNEWYKVYYSGPDGPCGAAPGDWLAWQKAEKCQSGWVKKKGVAAQSLYRPTLLNWSGKTTVESPDGKLRIVVHPIFTDDENHSPVVVRRLTDGKG